jgi:hypothetical protein
MVYMNGQIKNPNPMKSLHGNCGKKPYAVPYVKLTDNYIKTLDPGMTKLRIRGHIGYQLADTDYINKHRKDGNAINNAKAN